MALVCLFAAHVGAAVELPKRFASRYDAVIQAVDAGALPAANGERARSVSLALRQDLIRIDADIQAARLAVRETQCDAQTQALDEVAALSARRERRIAKAVQRLDGLATADREAPASMSTPERTMAGGASRAAAAPAPAEKVESKPDADGENGRPIDNIRIVNEPEDFSEPMLE